MRRIFLTRRFERKLKLFDELHPDLMVKVEAVMYDIVSNPFRSTLKTHKLSGQLKDCFASRINYKYRLVFQFSEEEITFIDIGSHEEVY